MMTLVPLFIFWGLWYLNFSTRAIFSPILPLIEDTLLLSHGEAGGLFTSLAIGNSLILLISGRFAAVWGYKRTVVSGFIGIGLIFLGLQWADSYLAFHILFFLLGIAAGTYLPSILPIITVTYESRHWGKVIGIHDSAASLSILSIPIFVALGVRFLSWRILLLFLGTISLLLPIYFWKVSVEPKKEMSHQRNRTSDLLKRRSIWIIGFLWIFASASSMGLYSILPLYLIRERGIDFDFANTLFGISRVGGVFVSVFTGFLIDRYGYRLMLMFCLVTTGLSTIGLALSSTLPMIVITLVFQATLSVGFFPAGFATLTNLTPLSERSMAIGLAISLGTIFGNGGAPVLLGIIADHSSFEIGIIWLGILTILSSLAVRLLEKEHG
jgi:MFS family permease